MQEQIGKVTIQYREEEILLQTEALEDARIRELLAEGYDCRQQQAQAFFQYSFHFFVSPSRENARPLLLQNRLKRLSSSLYHKHIPIRNKKRPAAARRFLHIAFHPNQSCRYNCRQTECFGSVRRPRNCLGTPSTGRPAPKWARTDHRQYFLSSFHPAFPCCTRRPTERYR